jgi:hypothetical protein
MPRRYTREEWVEMFEGCIRHLFEQVQSREFGNWDAVSDQGWKKLKDIVMNHSLPAWEEDPRSFYHPGMGEDGDDLSDCPYDHEVLCLEALDNIRNFHEPTSKLSLKESDYVLLADMLLDEPVFRSCKSENDVYEALIHGDDFEHVATRAIQEGLIDLGVSKDDDPDWEYGMEISQALGERDYRMMAQIIWGSLSEGTKTSKRFTAKLLRKHATSESQAWDTTCKLMYKTTNMLREAGFQVSQRQTSGTSHGFCVSYNDETLTTFTMYKESDARFICSSLVFKEEFYDFENTHELLDYLWDILLSIGFKKVDEMGDRYLFEKTL